MNLKYLPSMTRTAQVWTFFGSRILSFFCLGLLACVTALAAPRKPAHPPAPAGNRFLFVVETSSAMLPFEHAGRQAVFDLVYSGLGNQMQPGDTIGLWTFGEEVHGGVFPMQVWQPEQNLQLASQIGLFLKKQPCENHARLDRAVPKLLSLIKGVQDVNILLISGTEHTWKGTSFDADLNSAAQKAASTNRSSKRPLITTFVARKGAVVQWSVTAAGDPISLPPPAIAEKMVQTETAPAPNGEPKSANAHEASSGATPLAAHPAAPEPTRAPPKAETGADSPAPAAAPIKRIVITSKRAEPDEEPKAGDVRITVRTPKPVAGVTQPEPPPNPASESTLEGNTAQQEDAVSKPVAAASAPVGPATEKADPAPAPLVVQNPPAPKPASLALPTLAPGALVVAAREKPASNRAAPPLAMAHPPAPFLTSRSLFLIGAGLIAIALVLGWWTLRFFHKPPQPSFITRSFERDIS